MVKNDRKATLQALHSTAVVKADQYHERNVVLHGRPPPISNCEKELTRKELTRKELTRKELTRKELTRKECSTFAHLGSGYCRLLGSYKNSIKKDAN